MDHHSSVLVPGLALLANELLDMIIEHLSFDDRAALANTSESLMRQMEVHLLATRAQRDWTFIRSSRLGYAHLMRRALSLGASAQSPFVISRKDARHGPRPNPVLVLRLPVKSNNEEAFQLLVDHGASIESFLKQAEDSEISRVGIDYEINALLWLLARPDRVGFLRRFCEDDKLPPLRPEQMQTCLRYTVHRSLFSGVWPDETVKLLVARGADIRELQSDQAKGRCPVAVAILRGHAHIAEELLRLGADVHGKKPAREESLEYYHIPIFAAARRMAVDGPSIVQCCLAWGANPRHSAELRLLTRKVNDSGNFQKRHVILSTPLPIYIYLASIDWTVELSFSPLEGLRFWLDLGPSFEEGVMIRDPDIEFMYGMHTSLYSILLAKWGPNLLACRPFYEVMKELGPRLTDWEMRDVKNSVCSWPHAFKPPQGIALERWIEIFGVEFPCARSSPTTRYGTEFCYHQSTWASWQRPTARSGN
ncbi:hypothetical protein NLG97_g2566 [Lecanicillium saksenae]|uniref:Uncharacterized protein n=1 Tax=Lecanicillium saksenae TaxID=468837 RepID=A0ACC1R296_9HYPO|nr:hypothetical protein NLG97_g2566 [Lecanicillium saksenae]